MSKKTILVFTGGGLAPALNATLYGVITSAQKKGWRVLGGVSGWQSLMPGGKIIDLTTIDVEVLKSIGGTFLRSSRDNPLKNEMGIESIKRKMQEFDIDYLVPIGGDNTLGAARVLSEEHSLPIIAIPKTVDNDLSGTYWTPGFPTAADRIINMTRVIKEEAAYTLKRIFLIEAIGLDAGWICGSSSIGKPDLILVPEKEVEFDKFLELLHDKYQKNGDYATAVVSEHVNFDKDISGVKDDQPDGFDIKRQSFVSVQLKQMIMEKLGITAQVVIPRNYLQAGPPIEIDRKMAIELGQNAVELLAKEESGLMSCVEKAGKEFNAGAVSLKEVVGEGKYKRLTDDYYDFENFQVKDKLRKYLNSFIKNKSDQSGEYEKLIKKVI